MVCLLAAPCVQLFVSAGNGWPHNALRHHWLMPISCHFRDCKKRCWSITSLTHKRRYNKCPDLYLYMWLWQELLATCQGQIERCFEARRNAAAAAGDDDDDDSSPSNDSRKRRALTTVVTPTDVRDISLNHAHTSSTWPSTNQQSRTDVISSFIDNYLMWWYILQCCNIFRIVASTKAVVFLPRIVCLSAALLKKIWMNMYDEFGRDEAFGQ